MVRGVVEACAGIWLRDRPPCSAFPGLSPFDVLSYSVQGPSGFSGGHSGFAGPLQSIHWA